MSSKKNASLDALINEASVSITENAERFSRKENLIKNSKGRPNTKGERKQFPLQIPLEVHDQLREYA